MFLPRHAMPPLKSAAVLTTPFFHAIIYCETAGIPRKFRCPPRQSSSRVFLFGDGARAFCLDGGGCKQCANGSEVVELAARGAGDAQPDGFDGSAFFEAFKRGFGQLKFCGHLFGVRELRLGYVLSSFNKHNFWLVLLVMHNR